MTAVESFDKFDHDSEGGAVRRVAHGIWDVIVDPVVRFVADLVVSRL